MSDPNEEDEVTKQARLMEEKMKSGGLKKGVMKVSSKAGTKKTFDSADYFKDQDQKKQS
jgi:hypothetical protein